MKSPIRAQHRQEHIEVNNLLSDSTDRDARLDGRNAVPWPGHTYMIIEKSSDRAITLENGVLHLGDSKKHPKADMYWLCIEKNGYFAFQNIRSGKYMGHDGNQGIRALATNVDAWEMITTRAYPGGGHQMLVPHWWHTLRIVSIAEDGESLVTREHGTTSWEFVRRAVYKVD